MKSKKIIFPNKNVIEIIGNVGSGKTTFAKKLSKLSNLRYIDIDLYLNNDFLPLTAKNPERWTFTTGLQFSYQRSKKIESVKKIITKSPIVLDQGFDMGIQIYSKNSYIYKLMNDSEWKLLQELHANFMKNAPAINTIFFINTPVNLITERLNVRNRAHEKFYSKEYIMQLEDRLSEYKKELIKQGKTVIEYNSKINKITVFGKSNKTSKLLIKLWNT